jgi:hypothetical protein
VSTIRSPRSPRWDFLGRYKVHVNDELFIDRWRLLQNPLFAILLTRIYKEDTARDPHNHSRPFITIALTGAYIERVWPDPRNPDISYLRQHPQFLPVLVHQTDAHEIIHIRRKLRTLVFAGRHHGTFYFWTKDGPVDWKEYR